MEKVWAKLNGNYETIIAGNSAEAFDLLGGCPTTYQSTSTFTATKIYELVDEANKKNYIMGVGCCNANSGFGDVDLASGHAYTALGAVTITNATGSW